MYALEGAKDNAAMESLIGRFKEENRSLFLDAQSLAGLTAVVDERVQYYDTERRHSAIGYQSPVRHIERVRSNLTE